MIRHVRSLTGAERLVAMAYDTNAGTMEVLAAYPASPLAGVPTGPFVPDCDLVAAAATRNAQDTHIYTRPIGEHPFRGVATAWIRDGITAVATVPVVARECLVGMLVLGAASEAALAGEGREVAEEAAAQLGVAIRAERAREALQQALERQRLVHEIDAAILASESPDVLAQRVAEPLRRLTGARRLDIGAYDTDRDRGRIIAFAHDGSSRTAPPPDEFPLRATIPLVDHADRGALVMGDLRELGSGLRPVQQAIAQGLFNTLWMPLVAGGRLLGGIGFAGDEQLRVDEIRSGLAREIGDQLALALLHDRDQAELASREAHLRTIIEGSPNGIVVIDERGVIQLANPAAETMFRVASGSLIGQSVGAFVPDASQGLHPGHVDAWFRAPASVRIHPVDTEARRSDGTRLPIHVLLAPVDTPDGRIAIVTIIDLTEREALESRLRQAERLEVLGQFAGILAHDVRNHLAAVTWSTELMAAEMPADSPHREDVEIIRRATRDAISITSSVLDYARPSGEVAGTTDVGPHLRGLQRMLARILGDEVSLELEIGPGLPPAAIDGTALTQVIVNLASNARHAMPSGGCFRIQARLHPGTAGRDTPVESHPHIHIEVSDTGHGMDETTRQRAFEAFYTTKAGPAAGQRGTGLGLSSVFFIVTRAGGAIHVASKPGAGSTFTVDLPIANGS